MYMKTKPVYAVYKEGEDFDDEEVDYFEGYIDSKKNKLK